MFCCEQARYKQAHVASKLVTNKLMLQASSLQTSSSQIRAELANERYLEMLRSLKTTSAPSDLISPNLYYMYFQLEYGFLSEHHCNFWDPESESEIEI